MIIKKMNEQANLNIYNRISSYLSSNDLSLKCPRITEEKSIIDTLQPLSNYILGGDFGKNVFIIECYTKRIFPRFLSISQSSSEEYAVLWDSHLWDLYAHFFKVYYEKTMNGLVQEEKSTNNYLISILFSYLSCRFFNEPTFSLELAKVYNSIKFKVPPYNEQDNIMEDLKSIGIVENISVAKLFVFAHEITHIAFKEGLPIANVINSELRLYCDIINKLHDLNEELNIKCSDKSRANDQISDNSAVYSVAKHILNNPDDLMIEEICCDALSLIVVNEFYKQNTSKTEKQRKNLLSSIIVFRLFYWWLYSTEEFWGSLKSVHEDPVKNDCAFVDPNNKYYNIGKKITEKLNTRMALTLIFVNDKYDLGIFGEDKPLVDLIDILQSNSVLYIDRIMNKILDEYYKKYDHLFARVLAEKEKQNIAASLLGWVHENRRNTLVKCIMTKDERTEEALRRIGILIRLYGLNPNVLHYFEENRLYYSYLTGGGFIGSIDTISYSRKYEELVSIFENSYNCTVYHAIECDDSLFLLYVGNDKQHWFEEVPISQGIFGALFNLETATLKFGYIQVDTLNGALYRRSKRLYTAFDLVELDQKKLTDIDLEVIKRLNIMITQGLISDLDIIELYKTSKEVMFSMPMTIFGNVTGVVNRASDFDLISQFVNEVNSLGFTPFFCIYIKKSSRVAVLYVSSEKEKWEFECDLLNNNTSPAVVFDLIENKVEIKNVYYTFSLGGPII